LVTFLIADGDLHVDTHSTLVIQNTQNSVQSKQRRKANKTTTTGILLHAHNIQASNSLLSSKRYKAEKPQSNSYTTKEVNQRYKDSVNGPLTLRRTATYQLISGALVRQRTIPTERPPLVGEISTNFSG
jgi:hypothetical protein